MAGLLEQGLAAFEAMQSHGLALPPAVQARWCSQLAALSRAFFLARVVHAAAAYYRMLALVPGLAVAWRRCEAVWAVQPFRDAALAADAAGQALASVAGGLAPRLEELEGSAGALVWERGLEGFTLLPLSLFPTSLCVRDAVWHGRRPRPVLALLTVAWERHVSVVPPRLE